MIMPTKAIARLWAIPMLLVSSAGCSQPIAPDVHSSAANSSKGESVAQSSQPGAIADLPFAQGRSFASLDEYLAFRERRGASDVPWYREIEPGLYELVSRRAPGAQPKTYTRAELAQMFGFKE